MILIVTFQPSKTRQKLWVFCRRWKSLTRCKTSTTGEWPAPGLLMLMTGASTPIRYHLWPWCSDRLLCSRWWSWWLWWWWQLASPWALDVDDWSIDPHQVNIYHLRLHLCCICICNCICDWVFYLHQTVYMFGHKHFAPLNLSFWNWLQISEMLPGDVHLHVCYFVPSPF